MNKLLLILTTALLFSCEEPQMKTKTVEQVSELPDASSVPLELDMSDHAKDIVSNCQTCHTARYIEMQPKLSKKVWQKTVDKMIHVYGAPIDSITAQRIVDYLAER